MKIDSKLDENGYHFDCLFFIWYGNCWEYQTLVEWLDVDDITHFDIIFHLFLHKFIDVSRLYSFTHHFRYCLWYYSPCASDSLTRTSFYYHSWLCCFFSHFLIFFFLILLWRFIFRSSNRWINRLRLDNFFFCWFLLLLLSLHLLLFRLLSFHRRNLILRYNNLRFLLVLLLI